MLDFCPKVYISFCNIVLTLAINSYTSNKKKANVTSPKGNYTRRNRSDGGQSQAVNSGMYTISSILVFALYWIVYSDLIASH